MPAGDDGCDGTDGHVPFDDCSCQREIRVIGSIVGWAVKLYCNRGWLTTKKCSNLEEKDQFDQHLVVDSTKPHAISVFTVI